MIFIEMFNLKILLVLVISAFLSWYFLKLLIPILNKFFIDNPNNRSSHDFPKPSAGGIPFVLVITSFETIMGNFQPLICLPLAIIGFCDDLRGMSKYLRYFFQVLTILFLMINSSILFLLKENFQEISSLFLILFIVFFGTAIINFTNFMDGSDGIVAGSMIIIYFVFSLLVSNSYMTLCGALIGFICWNWYPSKVFMGDGGSTFLGALLVGLIFNAESMEIILKILIIISPLFCDALICLLRRLFYRQRIFEAHCSHLYQRLVRSGWSHSEVAILYMGCIFAIAIIMIIGGIKFIPPIIISEFLLGFWLDQNIALPFTKSFDKR